MRSPATQAVAGRSLAGARSLAIGDALKLNTKTNSDVVVVDGSNIATEGRSTPSLAQLNDAVMAFRDEFPDAVVTVVVDATFGHRIDRREAVAFDEAVAHNELVAPPAGAIGRGDAFVLSIANKVGARVLSNDSFQEFHGDYPWLFDEGRLIGGKPVPFVGWVFVERLPVKGAVSRKAQRAARGGSDRKVVRRSASREASQPMPVPTSPPPSVKRPAASVTPNAACRVGAGARPARRLRRRGQRPPAVPRFRRAPPDQQQRQRSRRVVLIARGVRHDRRHPRLCAASLDGGLGPAECPRGDAHRRCGDPRRDELRPGAAQRGARRPGNGTRRSSCRQSRSHRARRGRGGGSDQESREQEGDGEEGARQGACQEGRGEEGAGQEGAGEEGSSEEGRAAKKALARKEPAKKAAAKQVAQKAPAMKATATKESAKKVAAKKAVGTTTEGPPTRKRTTRKQASAEVVDSADVAATGSAL